MKLRDSRLWVALFSAGAVLFIVFGNLGRSSPGVLASVHQREPSLSGVRSCSECHGGWFTTMSDACLECHEEIEVQVDGGSGLHGSLGREEATRCAFCHSDHHGENFAMVNGLSFRRAGVLDPDDFDHGIVGFDMRGRHRELDCNKCHLNADINILAEGQRRFLGLSQACASCHEDSHGGRYVLSCVQCHGQEAFDELDATGHEAHLPLIGGHEAVSCSSCHAAGTTYSLEALGSGRRPAARTCVDCHDSPHDGEFIAGVAELERTAPGASCVECHEPEHMEFAGATVEVTPEHHARSGFALEPPHHEATCEDCHAPELGGFAARYPGRGADDCAKCHEDPHAGQFDQGPFAEAGCVGCHDRHQFEPHAFTVEKHARTGLELTGSHLETDCSACHTDPAEGEARVFHGTPAACESCHEDAHRGFFDEIVADDRGSMQGCARCHDTTTFSSVHEEPFDHGRWTGFGVRGAHAQLECEVCHPRSAERDELGRTLGRVADHFGAFEGCVTCHDDPHGGQFVDAGRDCSKCHVETSFRAFPDGFDHGRWTGFALSGAHGKAECTACHAPLRDPDPHGRTLGRAAGQECSDCHIDSHGGQFAVRGRTDCRRCHKSAASFHELKFRHNLDSRFRLDGAHQDLACSACHHPVQQGETKIVRYKPLRTRCVDCHGGQKEPLRRRKGRRR